MKNAVVVYVLLVPSHVIKKGSYSKWMVHNKKVLVFLVLLSPPFAYHMNLQYKLFQPCTFSLQKLFILIIIFFLVFLLKRDLLQSFVPICKQYKNYEQCVFFLLMMSSASLNKRTKVCELVWKSVCQSSLVSRFFVHSSCDVVPLCCVTFC